MIYIFYASDESGAARRLGSFSAESEAAARGMARGHMRSNRDVLSVEVWAPSGELFRMDRSCLDTPPVTRLQT